MDNSIFINAQSQAVPISDISILPPDSGGSTAELKTLDDYHVITCQLNNVYEYPYCELDFPLISIFQPPLDLTHFEAINITLKYQPPATQVNNQLRVQIRSYSPIYSNIDDINTYTLNEVIVPEVTTDKFETVTIHSDAFSVPSWWFNAMKLKDFKKPDLSKAVSLKIVTPELAVEGKHVITIESIIIKRKIIQFQQLLIATALF